MSCPHGAGRPEDCSQCLGAVPKRIELVDGVLTVDGQVLVHRSPQSIYYPRKTKRGRR